MDKTLSPNRPRVLPNGPPMDPKRAEEMLAEWDRMRQEDKKNNSFLTLLLRKLHIIK